jgi:hypothetical protein
MSGLAAQSVLCCAMGFFNILDPPMELTHAGFKSGKAFTQ